MNTRFINIALAAVLAMVVVGVGWWYLSNSSPVPSSPEHPGLPESTDTVPQQPATTPTPPAESVKIISCNPRGYDAAYFQQEKPCVSDMTAVDIERESKALSIIEKASAGNTSKYCPFPQLYASDKRYSVMLTNCAPKFGYVVVDLSSERITDFFRTSSWTSVEETAKRIVFLDPIISNQQTIGEKVRWYVFGTESSKAAVGSELYWPQSYPHIEGPMGNGSTAIIASSDSSITLGIHDRNKSSAQGDSTVYEQTGTRVISF